MAVASEALPQSRLDERELVSRIKHGDTAACAVCIESHSPALYRLALRMLNDEAEAEDVLQETFVNAFKSFQGFDSHSSLGTWLYRITYNSALMRLRKRHPEVSLDQDEGADHLNRSELIDWDDSPDQLIVEHEAAQMLGDAINHLPESLRQVFILREMEDLPTSATAQRLGITQAAVKVRLHRARKALRQRLGVYFAERAPQAPLLPRAKSLACGEALEFLEAEGRATDESLRTALRDYIASCQQCRMFLDSKHQSVLLYSGDHKARVPKEVQHRLYERIRPLWIERTDS